MMNIGTGMLKNFKLIAFFFFLTLQSLQAFPSERPEKMLERVTDQMLSTLKTHNRELKKNPQGVVEIIDKILVPHVDETAMARWVAGRNGWQKATPSQRALFTNAFRDLLIRTYASTLMAFDNQKVEYFPIRGSIEGKQRVQVASVIREPGKEQIKVTYRLIAKSDAWKVYDISIEGVSLLKGFQSQFSQEIERNGMDSVIQRMKEHNKKPIK